MDKDSIYELRAVKNIAPTRARQRAKSIWLKLIVVVLRNTRGSNAEPKEIIFEDLGGENHPIVYPGCPVGS